MTRESRPYQPRSAPALMTQVRQDELTPGHHDCAPHQCDRDNVEQTPDYGHCIVRCPVCHRPGIRTYNPVQVHWEDELLSLTERVSLAMAAAEGNEDAQARAVSNNYDALGYTALAKAAITELGRLGALAWPATADTATGAAGKP